MYNGKTNLLLSIGDVSKLLNIPSHTLRYWEMEFADFLHPVRTKGQQRRYNDEDIKTIEKIAGMLRVERYSIAGAKRALYEELKKDNQIEKTEKIVVPEVLANEIANLIKEKLMVKEETHEVNHGIMTI